MSGKSSKRFRTKISNKKFPTKISNKNFEQKFPTNISNKNFDHLFCFNKFFIQMFHELSTPNLTSIFKVFFHLPFLSFSLHYLFMKNFFVGGLKEQFGNITNYFKSYLRLTLILKLFFFVFK